ncbi:hypothetical protein ACRAWF_23275 [Streptomyces sp. L7]
MTYEKRMTLHVGEVTAELLHLGPAHTTDDTVVWLPWSVCCSPATS